jgi:hypothetical protein
MCHYSWRAREKLPPSIVVPASISRGCSSPCAICIIHNTNSTIFIVPNAMGFRRTDLSFKTPAESINQWGIGSAGLKITGYADKYEERESDKLSIFFFESLSYRLNSFGCSEGHLGLIPVLATATQFFSFGNRTRTNTRKWYRSQCSRHMCMRVRCARVKFW